MAKPYSELKFTDDFMFGKILTERPDLCKELIELILNVEVSKIEYVEKQKTIEEKYDAKGVRLDVYVKDGEGTVYDLDMQATLEPELPKRMRYYQGMIDMNTISRGYQYGKLNKSKVIFICKIDHFGLDLPVYNFKETCVQDQTLFLGDETEKVVVNGAGSS